MSDDLVEWLLVQIATDEVVAKAAQEHEAPGQWWVRDYSDVRVDDDYDDRGKIEVLNWEPSEHYQTPSTRLWQLFQPARVLAECAAKREILGRHTEQPWEVSGEPTIKGTCCEWCSDEYVAGERCDWPCPDIGNLLTIYADRPGASVWVVKQP